MQFTHTTLMYWLPVQPLPCGHFLNTVKRLEVYLLSCQDTDLSVAVDQWPVLAMPLY
jgi:hypothetical protein